MLINKKKKIEKKTEKEKHEKEKQGKEKETYTNKNTYIAHLNFNQIKLFTNIIY